MKKILSLFLAASLLSSTSMQAHFNKISYLLWGDGRSYSWSKGDKHELETAKLSALKSIAYLVGYAALKKYLPNGGANVGFRDEPFYFFLPINASMGAAAMSAWNAVKAAHHYYRYETSKVKIALER